MPSEKSHQAYKIVDKHKFMPAKFSNSKQEEIILYFPLMFGESNTRYVAHNPIDEIKCKELKASREKFCDFFTDLLSAQVSHEMDPRSKIKHIICSAAIKAAEISLWTTYSLINLSVNEKIELIKGNELRFTKDSFQLANEIFENERNESPQEFRLVQFRIRWIEQGKRKTIWSRINPVPSGEWFNTISDEVYAESVKAKTPDSIPELILKHKSHLQDFSKDRIEKYKSTWGRIIKSRYEVARLTCEINNIDLDEIHIVLSRDKILKQLDLLITMESCLSREPSLDNLLPNPHIELLHKFSRYSEKFSETVIYNDEPYVLDNVKFCPAVYDLADNCLDLYSDTQKITEELE